MRGASPQRRSPRSPGHVWCLAALVLSGCGGLETEGDTDRFVAETVTLTLRGGDKGFSGGLKLKDAEERSFGAEELQVVRPDERTLHFAIPLDAAVGAARLNIGQAESIHEYELELRIHRAALALDDTGTLELLPLPPSELPPVSRSIGDEGGALAISPLGSTAVVLIDGRLSFVAIDRELREVASLKLDAPTVLAALPSGALVAGPSSIQLYQRQSGQGVLQLGSFAIAATQAMAASADGSHAVALTHCDTDSDQQPDADCVVPFDLSVRPPTAGAAATVDATASATFVALTADGAAAVVADTDAIRSVVLASGAVGEVSWTGTPSAIAHARVDLDGTATDLFAVADHAAQKVRLLQWAGGVLTTRGDDIDIGAAPRDISFGHGGALFVVTDGGLVLVDAAASTPVASDLALSPTNTPAAFAAQP